MLKSQTKTSEETQAKLDKIMDMIEHEKFELETFDNVLISFMTADTFDIPCLPFYSNYLCGHVCSVIAMFPLLHIITAVCSARGQINSCSRLNTMI